MMGNNSFYSDEELASLGLGGFGDNVLISRKCSIYGAPNMVIGSNVRIDDFCILSGKLTIGSNVHIAAYCGLFGSAGILLEDFSGLSSRVSIYSDSEDYTGEALTNPTVPHKYRKVDSSPVMLRKHAIVGSGTVILPGVEIGEGASIGALSLVTRSLEPWGIYSGTPARRIRERKRDLLKLEEAYQQETRTATE